MLAARHPHPRDARIVFDEGPHVYRVDGQPYPKSVSGVVEDAFPKFDAAGIVEKQYPTWKEQRSSPYYRLIQYLLFTLKLNDATAKAEIIRSWRAYGESRAQLGTDLHYEIETYLNGARDPAKEPTREFAQFLAWYAVRGPVLGEPYRTEWSLFSEDVYLAGQLDCLFRRADGSFVMVDWKCVEALPDTKQGFNKGFGNPPCQVLPNTNLSHYYLQQNLYRWFLRTHYGIDVREMYLLQVHPSLAAAREHQVPNLDVVVDELMSQRRRYLELDPGLKQRAPGVQQAPPCERCCWYRELANSLALQLPPVAIPMEEDPFA